MSEVKVAKLFRNGGSQAVRLPAEFRFEGDEVYVRRDEATGDVILSNASRASHQAYWDDLFARFDSIPQEERDEFARIMDEIVADRQRRPVSAASRRAYWDEFFARLDANRVEDEDFDTYMTERPMNAPIRHRNVFEDEG
jgi:antitoxin VapB